MKLLTRLLSLFKSTDPDDPALAKALQRAADRVEPLLRQTPGWPRRYRRPIAAALRQSRRVSATIPGPVEIDDEHYARDPFVHALFGSPDEIRRILSTSRVMRDYVAAGTNDEACALLTMRRLEKHTFGIDMDGEVMRREMPQDVVWYTDHQLAGPAPSEAEARENLLWVQFDHFLERVKAGVGHLQAERDRLAHAKDLAMARLKAAESDRRAEQRQALEQVLKQLAEITETLELDHLAEVFGAVLSHPEDCLFLQPHTLVLDGMGVVRPARDQTATAASLDFMDLFERYEEPRTVVLVHCRNLCSILQDEPLTQAERWLV